MGRFTQGIVATAALAGALSFTQEADAAPVPQGTFAVSAERLAASNLVFFPGGPSWNNQFFGAPGIQPFDTPRLGVDYFVIDGLSIGGHLGFGFYVPNGGNAATWIALMPRVGYAFSLSQKIDFWPRIGAGLIAGDAAGDDTGVLTMEAMFLANLNRSVAIEFGPAADIPFGGFWPDAIIGGNAGLVVSF